MYAHTHTANIKYTLRHNGNNNINILKLLYNPQRGNEAIKVSTHFLGRSLKSNTSFMKSPGKQTHFFQLNLQQSALLSPKNATHMLPVQKDTGASLNLSRTFFIFPV